MALSLKPERLKRFAEVARLILKYGRGDLLRVSELHPTLLPAERTLSSAAGSAAAAPEAEELARDLEAMGRRS